MYATVVVCVRGRDILGHNRLWAVSPIIITRHVHIPTEKQLNTHRCFFWQVEIFLLLIRLANAGMPASFFVIKHAVINHTKNLSPLSMCVSVGRASAGHGIDCSCRLIYLCRVSPL